MLRRWQALTAEQQWSGHLFANSKRGSGICCDEVPDIIAGGWVGGNL
nr:MAG TPA: hypothetical protein [Caudoviricetes sp.]